MTILGIDPGTATTGYGVVCKRGSQASCLTYGVIKTPAGKPIGLRLQTIYDGLCALLDRYTPEVMVVEHLFFGKNTTNALSVGRTVGIAMLAASQRNIPIVEYKPMEVKLSVVGYGHADKEQVQFMIRQILGLSEIPKPDDAADALALCITHAHASRPGSVTAYH
ncbi:MAG: crossover junction endodeoxyribonuclease RuvC [Armatimonadetes bacterium]|nr:crossover junction endodeoxyribonuclease RuvC [Armatimonadota bacterium]